MSSYLFSDKLFGDKIEITLFDIDDGMAEMVTADAYREALRLQKIFNLYDKESELSLLNKKRRLRCSKELVGLINKALEYCRKTGGTYDISLGKTFLDRKNQGPEAIPKCTYEDITVQGDLITLEHEDVLIDLGSIAKGFIVDKVVESIKDSGAESGLVEGRGDLRVFGAQEHLIDIQHPRKKDESIASIRVNDEAVATSGDYNQFKDNFNTSHILNNKHFASVTVIAKTLEEADVFATMIAVSDEQETVNLLNKRKELRAITVDKDLNINYYNFKRQ